MLEEVDRSLFKKISGMPGHPSVPKRKESSVRLRVPSGQLPRVDTQRVKVARYSFSGSIPPTFEHKLRRYKQRFGKINTTVVLDKDENLL